MYTSNDELKRFGNSSVVEEINLDGGAHAPAPGSKIQDEMPGNSLRYTTVGQLISARNEMLCDCYGSTEYSEEWREQIEAYLDAQERSWRKFVMQRAIPKSDWALFRELRDHILRQLTYTQRFGSFKNHVEKLMPGLENKDAVSRRELAVRLQSVKLMDKKSMPTSIKVAIKLLAMRSAPMTPVAAKALPQISSTFLPDTGPATAKAMASGTVSNSGTIANSNAPESTAEIHMLAQQLERNWKKRSALLASLLEYAAQMDVKKTDWHNVESMLNIVGRQWKAIGPVAKRHDQTAQEQQFTTCFNSIKVLLEEEYDRNAVTARQVLGLSSKLRAQPASSESLESALILHRRLEEIGLLRREDKDDLVGRIRRNNRAVVAARKEQLKSMHRWRALRSEALAIIKLVALSGKLFEAELLASYATVEPQLERFEDLLKALEIEHEPIHRGASQAALNVVFLHKQASYLRHLDEASEQLRLETLDAYNEAIRLAGNVEQALLDNDEKLAKDSLAMALDYMDYVHAWPENGEEIVSARLQVLQSNIEQL